MNKRNKQHKKQVEFEKGIKAAKRACQRWEINYKENPYCLGVPGNHTKDIYPCLKHVK